MASTSGSSSGVGPSSPPLPTSPPIESPSDSGVGPSSSLFPTSPFLSPMPLPILPPLESPSDSGVGPNSPPILTSPPISPMPIPILPPLESPYDSSHVPSSPPLPVSPPLSAMPLAMLPPPESSSDSLKRHFSPPLPTSPPPRSKTLRNRLSLPEEDTTWGNPSLPRGNYFEERAKKRRRIERGQDPSLFHGFELQQHAINNLNSDNLTSLQDAIEVLSKGPMCNRTKTIFDSLVLHYPNAFSLKLAKLLQFQPPFPIRMEIVSLLHKILAGNSKLNPSVLIELKNPILDSVKAEPEESLLPSLCETICFVAGRIYGYSLGGWEEFLDYVCSCITCDDSEVNHTRGLMMLAELPVEVHSSREFWLDQGNYDMIFANILSMSLFDLQEDQVQELLFDASATLMSMSTNLGRTDVCDSLFPILLRFIDRQGEEEVVAKNEVVLRKVRRLAELVSVDPGEIFDGREPDVFWSMIRLAELKGASDELKIAAIIVLKDLDEVRMEQYEGFMLSLADDEVKRVLAVSIDMMSCVEDDPVWYDVDDEKCKEAGMTETFYRGQFLLNWLSFEGNQFVVVPTVIDMITHVYAPHTDWRVRHAGMMALGSFAEGHFEGDMVHYFDRVAGAVLMLLNDGNQRVIWSSLHAIKCLSPYKDLVKRHQNHMTFSNMLLPIINYSLCPRVQSYAIIAIRYLITKCGLKDQISPFLEELVALLIVLLKHEKRKLQEEALEALRVIALSIRLTFRHHYYDATMKALKEIVLADYNSPSPTLYFRAKCLECMGYLVRKVEINKFGDEEASQVMETMVSLQEKLNITNLLTRVIILKALDHFCQCPKIDIDMFIMKMVHMLVRFAQLDIDLKSDIPPCNRLDEAKNLVETVRVRACNILSYFAVRSSQKFSPFIGKVAKIFVQWIDCSSTETRKAAISALPNVLLSIKVGVQNYQTQEALTTIVVKSLVEGLTKEQDVSTIILQILPRCIQTSGSFFTSQLIKMIADEINRIIGKIIELEIERVKEEETSDGGSECFPNEGIFQDANNLIETTVETLRAQFLPYVDALMSNVATFWVHDIPDRVTAYIISVFNISAPRFPEKLQKYYNKYVATACDALRENRPHCQLDAARAIGIGAEFGEHRFKTTADVAIARLCDLMTRRLSARATAVAALGKILEFQWDSIGNHKEVVQNWLNCLPLKDGYNEAIYAHGLLSKMIRRSDKYLFGDNNENISKIISTVKQILSAPDRLATEEAINLMIDFISQEAPFNQEVGSSSSSQPNYNSGDPPDNVERTRYILLDPASTRARRRKIMNQKTHGTNTI